MEEEFSKQLIA